MTTKLSPSHCAKLSVVVTLALAMAGCATYMGGQSPEDAKFVAVEVGGSKVWQGGGAIDLKSRGSRPLTLKVINTLSADHGFSIDTMKVKEVIKPGEERTITVALEDIDGTITEHFVYCQLHPKHVTASLKVTGKSFASEYK